MILSRTEKQALKDKIREIQGDFCYLHPKYDGTVMSGTQHFTQHKRDFDLEHKDDNKNNFALENLGLSCHSCNIRKMHEHQKELMDLGRQKLTEPKLLYLREGGREIESVSERIGEIRMDAETASRMSPEMRKSEKFFPVFEKYIIERVEKEGKSEFEDTLHSACYVSKIKVKTGKDWMKLVASSMGQVKIHYEESVPKWVVRRESKDNVKGERR